MISASKARRSQVAAQKADKNVQKIFNKISAKVEVKIELGAEEFFVVQGVEMLTSPEVDTLIVKLRELGYLIKSVRIGGGRGLKVMW